MSQRLQPETSWYIILCLSQNRIILNTGCGLLLTFFSEELEHIEVNKIFSAISCCIVFTEQWHQIFLKTPELCEYK